jgi:hypothetical protein
MNVYLTLVIPVFFVVMVNSISCRSGGKSLKTGNENYEIITSGNHNKVLVLFPCFPCDAGHTKREAFFLKGLENEGVTIILLDYNNKLFLQESEKEDLMENIMHIFRTNNIPKNDVYFGGFSSGGNIALLMGDYIGGKKTGMIMKGVFLVDSPVDLEQLYHNAEIDVKQNVSEGVKNEASMIINLLKSSIGSPEKIRKMSVFSVSPSPEINLKHYKKYKIRLYTEPAPEWHKNVRKRNYENTNSRMFENFYNALSKDGNTSCDLIKTENKGVRADGNKHPHSWSIVEQESLLEWLK